MMGESNEIYDRRVLLECAVAGIGFHDVFEIWDELYVGAPIALVRERDNKYDANAVAVALADDYNGVDDDFDFEYILGYVPRGENALLASMLDLGYSDLIEAEISELKNSGPINDRLHIRAYIRSREPMKPKEEHLRVMVFGEVDGWSKFEDEIWQKGYTYFRWGGFPPWERDLPECGDKVAFIHLGAQKAEVYLMHTLAVGDESIPYLKHKEEIEMVDDCSAYVLSVVKGPNSVDRDALTFLGDALESTHQPDKKLDREASERLMEMMLTAGKNKE